jgi:ribonuclease HII
MVSHPQPAELGSRSAEVRARRRPLVHRGEELHCSLAHEAEARARGFEHVAGLDEVGRGALCGPVFAGAVILGEGFDPAGIDDSKRLTARQRLVQAEHIRTAARAWSLGQAEPSEVDALGIVQATHLAMRRALSGLAVHPDLVLVDGFAVPSLAVEQWPMVKGDARSVSIAAASIVAKVARDELMCGLAQVYPGYGLEHNAGYGSREHREAIARLGLSPAHRRSFSRQLGLFDSGGQA